VGKLRFQTEWRRLETRREKWDVAIRVKGRREERVKSRGAGTKKICRAFIIPPEI